MKKVLIVENDIISAEAIQSVLEKSGAYLVTEKCSTASDALSSFRKEMPDVVLMDISLDGPIDGISTARLLNNEHRVPVIYLTKYTEEYVFDQAADSYPCGFIEKPYNDKELLRSISLALKKTLNDCEHDSLFSKVENGVFIYTKNSTYEKLLFSDILFIKSAGSSTRIYYQRGKENGYYTISMSSNHVVNKVNYSRIHKINRSAYVNIDKIDKTSSSHVYIDGNELKLGNSIKDNFLNSVLTRIKK